MEQILYIILGSLLAILGGFINQWCQNHQAQKKEDESLLFQAAINLLDQHPLDKLKADELKEIKFRDELSKIALRIRSRRYRNLAVELSRFALDKVFRTQNNLSELSKNVQKAINKPMIEEYEKQTKEIIEQIKKEVNHGSL